MKTNQRNGKKQGNTHHIEATDSEENLEEEDAEKYTRFHVAAKEREPYRVEINLNGFSTSMEVYTGAAAKIFSVQENQPRKRSTEETRNETDSIKAANIHW